MFFGTQSSSYIIAENLKIVNWFLHFSMEMSLQTFVLKKIQNIKKDLFVKYA